MSLISRFRIYKICKSRLNVAIRIKKKKICFSLTSTLRMRWHNWTNLLVPNIFMVTESFNASSNLTVAAEWKTTDTDRINISWSSAEMPSSGSVTSPATGMIFDSSPGESRRNFSNSWRKKYDFNFSKLQWPKDKER